MSLTWACLLGGCLLMQPVVTARSDVTEENIAAAALQLGSNRFLQREEASKFLWRAGEGARLALEAAAKSPDREVALRAQQLLEKLRLGIRPDTPPATIALILRYLDADDSQKRTILQELVQQKAFDTLFVLLRGEQNPSIQSQLVRGLIATKGSLAELLAADRAADVEHILEFAARLGEQQANYAVYLWLTGKLPEKLATLKSSSAEADRLLVARLLWISGQVPAAVEIVNGLGVTADGRASLEWSTRNLRSELWMTQGRWGEMAEIVDKDKYTGLGFEQPVERLGMAAFLYRLAGNDELANTRIAELKQRALDNSGERWYCAEGLLVVDRYDDAIEVLQAGDGSQAFDLLAAQFRYEEALELVGCDLSRPVQDWYAQAKQNLTEAEAKFPSRLPYRAARLAAVLAQVGRRQACEQLLNHAFHDAIDREEDVAAGLSAIVKAERKLGMEVQTIDHAALAIRRLEKVNGALSNYLASLTGDEAGIWWNLLRLEYPEESAQDTLRRIDALVKAAAQKLPLTSPEVEQLEQAIAVCGTMTSDDQLKHLAGLAGYCRQCGEPALARRCWREIIAQHPTEQAWIGLADLDAAEEKWNEAAEHYRQAWELLRQPFPLYRQGKMLIAAGRQAEGEAALDLARLLPLGAETPRSQFAKQLKDSGDREDAASQWDLVLRSGSSYDWGFGQALQEAGNATSGKDDLRAAQYWDRFRATTVRTSTAFTETESYLSMARIIHRVRARGLLKLGQADEALAEAKRALAALPGDTDTAISLIGEFEKAEHLAAADELFAQSYRRHEELCRAFPDSSSLHNGLAWLAGKTNRHLDEALSYGRRAVELAPDNAAVIDTLAWVHHQRGEHELALALARRCLELSPRSTHYRQQVEDFEKAAGNP